MKKPPASSPTDSFVGLDITWPINTPGWRSLAAVFLDDPLEGVGLSVAGRELRPPHVGWT